MKIYIAGLSHTSRTGPHGRIVNTCNPRWQLESYHYMTPAKAIDLRQRQRRIFLDSGAFTMFTKGVKVDLKAYSRFINGNRDIIDVAANLDAIVHHSEQITYDRQKWLEKQGCAVLPVHHVRDDDKWLQRYIDEGYQYICLGGMVPESTPVLKEWLDHVWHKYLTNPDGSPKVKVHGFGLTTLSLIFRYPWYSVDSTAWVLISRFGSVIVDLPHGDYKIDFSSRSAKQQDIESWHYRTLSTEAKAIVDKRLIELEAARDKDVALEKELKALFGYEQGYYPTALAEAYGWRDHFTICYFDRIQDRRVDLFKREQETLFT